MDLYKNNGNIDNNYDSLLKKIKANNKNVDMNYLIKNGNLFSDKYNSNKNKNSKNNNNDGSNIFDNVFVKFINVNHNLHIFDG